MRGLDLTVEPGEQVLLLGPSGAGKSTLLAGLAGLLDPAQDAGSEEGALLVDGAAARSLQARTSLLHQDPETSLVMARAGDDVAFGLENLGVPRAEIWPRVDAALDAVGFRYGRDRATSRLSGGEQQRLALAGAVVRRPGLLLLDEPTALLDPDGAALVRDAVRGVLATSGATLVVVEHRVAAWADLVDRVVVLEPGGGVAVDGRPDEVFARHGARLAAAGVWVPGAAPTARRRATSTQRAAKMVVADDVSFRYPGATVPALTGAGATVRAGRALAVTGANGSGKSTLALLLAGLLRPGSGAVTASRELAQGSRPAPAGWRAAELAERIGSVFQNPEHQFLARSVAAELRVGPLRAGATRAEADARADELLARLGLTHLAEANPFTLSGGEQRRLAVGTALANAPAVLVLDEPTFGQDLCTWSEVTALLAGLRDEGRALVVVTHDQPLVDALADEVLVLSAAGATAGWSVP